MQLALEGYDLSGKDLEIAEEVYRYKDEIISIAKRASKNELLRNEKCENSDEIPVYICYLAHWIQLFRKVETLLEKLAENETPYTYTDGRKNSKFARIFGIRSLIEQQTKYIEEQIVKAFGPKDSKIYRVNIDLRSWQISFIENSHGTLSPQN